MQIFTKYVSLLIPHNALPAAAVQVLLVFPFLFLYRLQVGECLPPDIARIARLQASYAQVLFNYFVSISR